MKKNGFWTFCFSLIPGAGEMYIGYMKRGLSLMILLGIFIALCMFIGSPIFALPIPILFAYSFFDTWHIRNKETNKDGIEDDYIWKDFDFESTFGKKIYSKRNVILGIILLIVGLYMLSDTVFLNISYRLNIRWLAFILETVLRYIPTILVAVSAVYLGYKLIIGKKDNIEEVSKEV